MKFQTSDGVIDFTPARVIVAGWTGRDKAAMEHHMAELEMLGIKRPATTPVFYRNSVTRLTTTELLQTPGAGSSGEVELIRLLINPNKSELKCILGLCFLTQVASQIVVDFVLISPH